MADGKYDLVVIGGGSGGLTAAGFAGRIGLKVAVIEMELMGGDCTHFGCVPSKALLKVAKNAHTARKSAKYGVHVDNVRVDLAEVKRYVQESINEVYQHETPEKFASKYGVEVIIGEARFVNKETVRVNERELTAKRIIIATGARPAFPPIEGLRDVPFHTYKTIFAETRAAEHLIIIGGGPIGIEMAQAHVRLGIPVTVIDAQMLVRDEPEVAEVMKSILEYEGVRFVESFVESVRKDGDEIIVRPKTGEEVRGDMLLVVTGRTPIVDTLDLDNAGVKYSAKGIEVDKYLRTNVPNIYAVGDVIGGAQFTHNSGMQGSIAARNALFPINSVGINEKTLPWVTFTEPEIGHVGLTEAQAREQHGDSAKTFFFSLKEGDRSVAEDDMEGFIKIIYKGSGNLLGVTIVANRAGEMLNEFTLAMDNNLSLRDLIGSMHAYPTYSDVSAKAISNLVIQELLGGFSGKVISQAKHILPL
ncbi:MAG: FAD-dependent oxidoreductase [Aggregatilineales bacterium]